MNSETIIRIEKYYQDLSRVTSSKIHDKNKVVKGANKILGGPSIRLYCLNLKYSYNLYIIIILNILLLLLRRLANSFIKCTLQYE